MRADFALIRADNAQFRSEILKTQSDLTKMLMKHEGWIAQLSERSVVKSPTKMLMKFNGEIAEPNEAQTWNLRFNGKRENNCDGPLNSRRWCIHLFGLVHPFLTKTINCLSAGLGSGHAVMSPWQRVLLSPCIFLYINCIVVTKAFYNWPQPPNLMYLSSSLILY